MPCMPVQDVQLQTNNYKETLPYGKVAELSRRTGLSERTIRDHLLGCAKQPRFRTVALFELGCGNTFKKIMKEILISFPDTVPLYEGLDESGPKYSEAVRPFDPHEISYLPGFLLKKLSICANDYIDKAVERAGKHRREIVAAIPDNHIKKILAGYCDWPINAKNHFEVSWSTLVTFANSCDCSKQDFRFLLSTAYPDLALAFWLKEKYSSVHEAAVQIDEYLKRYMRANSDCKLPSIEIKTFAK